MRYFIEAFKGGFLVTIKSLKAYPKGMSRLQTTYAHAEWVAEWFLRNLPKKQPRLKKPIPLNRRFPSPRAYPPQAFGLELAMRITK